MNKFLTTFTNYGSIDVFRQGEVIRNMTLSPENKPATLNDIKNLMKEIALQNRREEV